jgi:hypothetical protein
MSAEHNERGASLVQRDQQIAKVFGELDQLARLRTNLQGMRSRG